VKDRIEELARECGIHERHSDPNELWCYKRNLHAFAQAIHNEALELAAKECENYPKRDPAEDGNGYWASENCAEAIRKLKV
jgi:hypothetical protein